MTLQRFEENWVELPTERIGEDEDYVYFIAESPSLSVFAITAAPAPTLPTQPFVALPPIWVIVITAIVLVAALIGVIWRYLSIGRGEVKEE